MYVSSAYKPDMHKDCRVLKCSPVVGEVPDATVKSLFVPWRGFADTNGSFHFHMQCKNTGLNSADLEQ